MSKRTYASSARQKARRAAARSQKSRQNAFEGGYADFWDDDIDSEQDDAWAAVTCKKLGLIGNTSRDSSRTSEED